MRIPVLVLTLLSLPGFASAQTAPRPRIAVVGLVHSHVWGHLKDMVEGKSVELVGVAEPNETLLAEAAKSGVNPALLYNAGRGGYAKMLAETKPDLVWAFVENNRHLEIARVCLPRRIALIFEKPLASTFADAQAIGELARHYKVPVMTNYQMAWWPANYVAKAAFDAGNIGTLVRLTGLVGHGGPGSEGPRNQFFFAWLTDPVQNGAGALMDFGCYNVLWSLWYLGAPQQLYSTARHIRPDVFPKVEDDATMVLAYPKATAVLQGSWNLPRSYQDLTLTGSTGTITMTRAAVILGQGRKGSESLPLKPLGPQEAGPLAYMAARLRDHQPVTGLTAIDLNIEVIHLIELAKQSIRTGQAVTVATAHSPGD